VSDPEESGPENRNSAIQVQVIQVTVTVREAYSPNHRYLCIISDSREAQIATQEAKSIIQQTATANQIEEEQHSSLLVYLSKHTGNS
jgi:hypothetical protein